MLGGFALQPTLGGFALRPTLGGFTLRPTLGGFAFRSGASPYDPRSGASPFAQGLCPLTHTQGLRLSLGGFVLRPTLGGFTFRSGASPFDPRSGASPFARGLRPLTHARGLLPSTHAWGLRLSLGGSALWPTPGGFTFSTCARGLHPFDLCSRTLPLDRAVQGRHTKLHTTRNKEGRCIHKKQARFIYLAESLRYDTLVMICQAIQLAVSLHAA
jgi:hypothetical protein